MTILSFRPYKNYVICTDINQIFGVQSAIPGQIVIQHLGSGTLSNAEWSSTIQLVAYKLIALSSANVNLCGSYVGIYSKNIHFQATDINGLKSNVFTKTMVVATGQCNSFLSIFSCLRIIPSL